MHLLTLLLCIVLATFGILLVLQSRQIALSRKRSEAPALLVAIAESTADAIFAKDIAGRYLMVSRAAARLLHRPPEEVLGKDDNELFPPAEAEHVMASDRRIRSTGEIEAFEEVLSTPEGPRVLNVIKGPLRDADGRIFGTYGISRDITERKQAESRLTESQERLRLLVDHAPAGLAIFDREMRYLAVNQRWREEYALSDPQVIGRPHYELFPELPQFLRCAHQRGLAGETVTNDEESLIHPDGRVQWQRWEVHPWHRSDGSVGGIVIFSEDITRRKLADIELKQRNQELERFNRAAIQRELRMIALKREVNDLARAAGKPAPYEAVLAEPAVEGTTP